MKKALLLVVLMIMILAMTGCNYSLVDTVWNFNYAYVSLPNGECIEGRVESWLDFEDGDQLQVKINGVTYLSHASRIVLVDK